MPIAFAETSGVVADFNNGQAVNNLGQKIEVWMKDNGADTTQSSQMEFVKDDALAHPEGFSLKIDYDVDSENPAYNGVRTELGGFDATAFKTLNFYLKGDAAKGFGKSVKIELIDPNGRPSPYMIENITSEWQKFSVPLTEFYAVNEWNALQKFVVVFADITSDPKVGTIYLDQIYFE